jgi:transcriptional regulator with XRE-family HTH domain
MKTKGFKSYLEKRLNKKEIAEIKKQAQLEVRILKSIQKILADTMADYMKQNDIGFNELVRRLDSSPAHITKIQKGEANLTLSSLAHLLALMGKEPSEVFKSKK